MNKVKELCVRRGIDPKEIVYLVGVSQPTVSDWFNQKKNPSGKRLERLSEVLGVSRSVILGYDDDPMAPVSAVDDFYPRPQNAPIFVLDGDPVMGWADDRPETQAIAAQVFAQALNSGVSKEETLSFFQSFSQLTPEERKTIRSNMKFLRSQRKEEEGT